MSALMQQHEDWKPRQARLWNAPPPAPKPTRVIPAVSPFVRQEREKKAQARQDFERRIANFRAGITEPMHVHAAAAHWPPYTPPVGYDICSPGVSLEPPRITMKQIIHEVADKHKMTVTELKSFRRTRHIVAARHEAIWRCKMETTNSLPAIGRAFGGFDHTTVLNAIKKHEMRMKEAASA